MLAVSIVCACGLMLVAVFTGLCNVLVALILSFNLVMLRMLIHLRRGRSFLPS